MRQLCDWINLGTTAFATTNPSEVAVRNTPIAKPRRCGVNQLVISLTPPPTSAPAHKPMHAWKVRPIVWVSVSPKASMKPPESRMLTPTVNRAPTQSATNPPMTLETTYPM